LKCISDIFKLVEGIDKEEYIMQRKLFLLNTHWLFGHVKTKKENSMIGLFIAIILFNFIAFKTNKRLNASEIVQIWTFTIAFQQSFDLIVEFKLQGYWYFDKGVNCLGLLAHSVLIPPVNMIFLNGYPYKDKTIKQIAYVLFFVIAILLYELITLLPSPWGYFHYGWWKLWHAAIVDPILLYILLGFYKWIRSLENKNFKKAE
jgi:hypothetical protein